MTERLRLPGRPKNFYPVLLTVFLQEYKPKTSCSGEGAFRKLPWGDRAKAGQAGAPRTGRQAGGKGGARGGAAPCLGRGRLPPGRRERVAFPAQGLFHQPPGRLPPLHRPSQRREGILANLGRTRAARKQARAVI